MQWSDQCTNSYHLPHIVSSGIIPQPPKYTFLPDHKIFLKILFPRHPPEKFSCVHNSKSIYLKKFQQRTSLTYNIYQNKFASLSPEL